MMFTPYGFNGDDYEDYDDGTEAPALRLAEAATACIEHGLLPCAECDGVGVRVAETEVRKEAA